MLQDPQWLGSLVGSVQTPPHIVRHGGGPPSPPLLDDALLLAAVLLLVAVLLLPATALLLVAVLLVCPPPPVVTPADIRSWTSSSQPARAPNASAESDFPTISMNPK
jgi:hypothetical protein